MTLFSIVATNIEKQYDLAHETGSKRAVDGVSFNIQEGERIGFIGANGAGKSTLLQMLAGIAEPSAGQLQVQGKVTAIFTLGMGLRDDLSGLENIYIEGELQGKSRHEIEKEINEIVAFAELGDFIDRPVRTYSTGMKARLAFSTIVHIDPEILVVDEALSVGDARFSAKATLKMKELARRGRILIVVSHSMGSIQDMCTRCIWLENGKIRQDGDPLAVTNAYLDQVRSVNEARLFERFSKDLCDDSMLLGWQVKQLAMCGGLDQREMATFVTGDIVNLRVNVCGPAGRSFDARLHLRRLDGVVVRESLASSCGHFPVLSAEGRADLVMNFGEMPLNYGIYLARLDTLVDGSVAARRSTLFEVVNPRPHAGGRPILIYPTTLNVTATTQ